MVKDIHNPLFMIANIMDELDLTPKTKVSIMHKIATELIHNNNFDDLNEDSQDTLNLIFNEGVDIALNEEIKDSLLTYNPN